MKKRLTKNPMRLTSVRVPRKDKRSLEVVCLRRGISQSEFLRLALRRSLEATAESAGKKLEEPSFFLRASNSDREEVIK